MVIYLDNAATTPLFPELINSINELNKTLFANPSSLHSLGSKSKKELNRARKFLAESINADEKEIIFMSGATEANNFVFKALNYDLIITSPSEHPCVLEPAKYSGVPTIWLNLNEEGFISFDELEQHLEDFKKKKVLVSIMHVNNETGTIQDLKRIGQLKTKYPNFIFHSDCVQSYGKLKIDVKKFKLDAISTSAHKLHGPKGIGFLYLRQDYFQEITLRHKSLIIGGGQESEIRSGTENLIGAISFAQAVKKNLEDENLIANFKENFEYFHTQISQIHGAVIHGAKDLQKRVPGIINVSFPQLKLNSEELVLRLDLAGLAVSSGSACSSNKNLNNTTASIQSSYVLRSYKIDEELAKKAIRISISKLNSREELEKSLQVIKNLN
jgi:cysteine desulfurase